MFLDWSDQILILKSHYKRSVMLWRLSGLLTRLSTIYTAVANQLPASGKQPNVAPPGFPPAALEQCAASHFLETNYEY